MAESDRKNYDTLGRKNTYELSGKMQNFVIL